MSNTSVTNFAFTSTLPKDAAGQKFNVLIRADASVAPFSLFKGIGTSVNDSGFMFSHMAVATHTRTSAIEATHPGVALVGVYLNQSDASKVESGQAQLIQSSRKGELLVNGASKSMVTDTTSANIYTLGSGILYGGYISGNNVNLGDNVIIKDGTTNRFQFIFSATSQTHPITLPAGGLFFSGSITHTRSIGANGATSITLFVDRP